MLDAAQGQLAVSGTLSLDAAAKAAGVTKAGLMYHFPTKEALMVALVDHIIDGYRAGLLAELSRLCGRDVDEPAQASSAERIGAYLRWACTSELGPADLVIFSDPALRERLVARWSQRLEPWTAIGADATPSQRVKLLAARLAADGIWLAGACGTTGLTDGDKAGIIRLLGDVET